MRLRKQSEAFGSVVNENELAVAKDEDFHVSDIIPYLKVYKLKLSFPMIEMFYNMQPRVVVFDSICLRTGRIYLSTSSSRVTSASCQDSPCSDPKSLKLAST